MGLCSGIIRQGGIITVLLLFNLLDYQTREEHEVSGGKRCTTHLPGQEAEVGHSGLCRLGRLSPTAGNSR